MQDVGAMTGLIAIASGAIVLGISYVGAFLLGRGYGQKEAERELRLETSRRREEEQDRLIGVEDAILSMSRSVERLGDAQRIMLLAQDRPMSAEPRIHSPRIQGSSTPA